MCMQFFLRPKTSDFGPDPYRKGPKCIFSIFFHDVLDTGEAMLAAKMITALETLPGKLRKQLTQNHNLSIFQRFVPETSPKAFSWP